MQKAEFKQIPIKDLTVSLEDFQGRQEAYSQTTYNRILNEVADGTFNFSALPAIMVWQDSRTGKWVILGGHSRTAAFTALSKGNLPMDPKYKPSDFSTIAAQIFVADNYQDALEQAKKVAQESNLAGQQSDIDFAFKVVRPLRESSKNASLYWQKMDDLFGGNKMTVHKLSFLNPDGKAVAMLKATKDLSDRQQKATVETIATYIGKARERMPELTNAHENELYDWLTHVFAEDAKAKKEGRQLNSQVSTETKFLDLIGSRVMRLGWTPDQPLNLELAGTKSIYQTTFDQTKAEKEKQIKDLQQAYNEERMKLVKLNWPTAKIEEHLQNQELYIIRLQRELAAYLQTYGEVEKATKNEMSLFDIAPEQPTIASNPPPVSDAPDVYTGKLKKLVQILRLSGAKAPEHKAEVKSIAGLPPFRSEILKKAVETDKYKWNYLLDAPMGSFLLEQLDYWLTEFEERTNKQETRYRQYKFDGDKYEPHIIREKTGYTDDDMLKQICETAIHIFSDYLIEKSGNMEAAYNDLVGFYKLQPKVEWRSSKSMRLQQYSTPVPIAYLMSKFCTGPAKATSKFLEPSAGTGLLTIGTNPFNWTINEIDKDRLLCMKFMGFENTYSVDGSQPLPFQKDFDAIMTNPPFDPFAPTDFRGYKIKKKEFVMAAYALNCMKDTGRAAIIVGQAMTYDKEGYVAPWATNGIFFNYLYRYFNVVDVISMESTFYVNMGAVAPIRIILIDGAFPEGREVLPPRFEEIENLPSTSVGSPHLVKNYEAFYERMFGVVK